MHAQVRVAARRIRSGRLAEVAVPRHAHAQPVEERPATAGLVGARLALELEPGPVGGLLGHLVEVRGLVEGSEVVVAHECELAALGHDVHAGDRIRSVADDVTKAHDAVHPLPVDVGEHGLQGLEVRMDVADEGRAQGGSCQGLAMVARTRRTRRRGLECRPQLPGLSGRNEDHTWLRPSTTTSS